MHWAARNGHLDVCKWLVGQGADPSLRTYDGDSPFNLAVWQGHRPTAEWLAGHPGADPSMTNRQGGAG
jgi:ankyrin repeat protein